VANETILSKDAVTSSDRRGSEVYVDDDGETMFFDAMQSFSDTVGSIAYAPTSTMPGRGASIAAPSTMLLSKTIADDSTNNRGNMRTVGSRQSVIDITRKLGSGSMAIRGYPGELSQEELDACLRFREELKRRDPAYREMVHAYSPAEDEEFALCRFLRAREFNVDEIFAMLDGNNAIKIWKNARDHDFYRDLGKIYNGCPLPVFMKLFPVVISGLAKNGATMFYFRVGDIDMNALECVTDLPHLIPYLWNMLHAGGTYSMQRELEAHGRAKTVLSERIIVVDMKNVPTSLFNTEFMKEAAAITACFPETMNRTVMMNVPTAFSLVWAVVKLFLEPRTLKKIGFFSWESKAKQDLLHFVDSEELLSDFGGTGKSFNETLAERQAENGTCSRYIVECIATGQRNPHFSFELSENETVQAIDVYSKGDAGAQISVKILDGKTVVEPCVVRRKRGAEGTHYAASLDTSKFREQGPGTFCVEALSSAKEFYLVAIRVACD
jgi:hypothetical protein